MIGIIAEENYTLIELKPGFTNDFGFRFKINKVLPDRKWGEYGFSFSLSPGLTCWWQWRNDCVPIDYKRIKAAITRKFRRAVQRKAKTRSGGLERR